ncbi:hypothetical protein FACS1894211_08300 [Clostridia bacterium]|nr:hypothetical protein FACS1894211_08300 [Clostridia bacterium]
MKYALLYNERAKENLRGILRYISKDNPKRALTYVEEIETAINNLAYFPFMGTPLKRKNNRMLLYGNYKITYEIKENKNQVYIKRVKHCAQDDRENTPVHLEESP